MQLKKLKIIKKNIRPKTEKSSTNFFTVIKYIVQDIKSYLALGTCL